MTTIMIKHYFIAACAAVMSLSAFTAAAQSNAAAPSADQQLVQRGEYLAKAGDCVACHTAKGGKPFEASGAARPASAENFNFNGVTNEG